MLAGGCILTGRLATQSNTLHTIAVPRHFSSNSLLHQTLYARSSNSQKFLRSIHSASPTPAEMSAEEYHEISDAYMDHLVGKLEELAEAREDIDVELSVMPDPLLVKSYS